MDGAIAFAANSSWNLINFRAPIISALQERGHRVAAIVPNDEAAPRLEQMGLDVYHVPVDARGVSPWRDARLTLSYYMLLRRLRPAALLGFTAKPNIYGSIAAAQLGIPVVNTISGLGTGFLSGRALQWIVTTLYRAGLRRSDKVLFHNPEDRELFVKLGIVPATRAQVVAGSGIDLDRFFPLAEPAAGGVMTFLFVGRLLKDKGALEFAEAAAAIKRNHTARFQMLGRVENHPKAVPAATIQRFERDGSIERLDPVNDVRPLIAGAHCVVLPSYREGLPRAILEASAMARPVVTTDVPGCRQAVDDGVTGLLCNARSTASLIAAIETIIGMPASRRAAMGAQGRRKAEREFSEEVVVATYLRSLDHIATR